MLKIKDDKWEEFCEKAESIGFDKFDNYGRFCFTAPKGMYHLGEPLSHNKDCLLVNASSCGSQNAHEIIMNFSDMLGAPVVEVAIRKQFDILFDLIKMGYVEKV